MIKTWKYNNSNSLFFRRMVLFSLSVLEEKRKPKTERRWTILHSTKGPDALDWQNLFGPSKNLDKICVCQIFNLVIVGALKNFFFRSCRANCKICTFFTPEKNLSCSKAGRRRLWSLVMLDKIWWEKNYRAHLYHGNDDKFFRKIHKNLPNASGPLMLLVLYTSLGIKI